MVLRDRAQVEAVRPNMALLEALDKRICISAADEEYDFCQPLFFCPGDGVPEDPVTGSTHSMLIPYWGAKLNKNRPAGAPGVGAQRRAALPVAR